MLRGTVFPELLCLVVPGVGLESEAQLVCVHVVSSWQEKGLPYGQWQIQKDKPGHLYLLLNPLPSG